MSQTLLLIVWIIPLLWLCYTAKAWWKARHQWFTFSADTKAFYLLVTPPLQFALDLLMATDRMLYDPGRTSSRME